MSLEKKFKEKLDKRGQSFTWFVKEYLPTATIGRSAIYNQVHGYTQSGISDEVRDAINSYLND